MKTFWKRAGWIGVLAVALSLCTVALAGLGVDSAVLPMAKLTVKELSVPAGGYSHLPGASFVIVLEGKEGAPMPSGSTGNQKRVTLTGKTGVTAYTVDFGQLTQVPIGQYNYIIYQETSQTDGEEKKFDYDRSVYQMQLLVGWKDGIVDGEIVSVISLSKDDVKIEEPELIFTNRNVMVDPGLQKLVVGSPTTPGTFYFEMKADNATYPMPDNMIGGVKIISSQAGFVEFGWITYTKAGIYTYTMREIPESGTGYTYDENKYQKKVVVTEDGDGGFNVTQQLTKVGGDGTLLSAATFINTYKKKESTPVEYQFPYLSKVITGNAPSTATRFTFSASGLITSTPGATCPMPKNLANGTASIVGAGTFDLGKITFTQEGEYVFTFTEQAGSVAGYTYSAQQYKVYITVKANASNALTVTRCDIYVDGSKTNKLAFTNTYSTGSSGGKTDYGSPKTGDERDTALLWQLLAISFVGMGACLLIPKWKKRKEA